MRSILALGLLSCALLACGGQASSQGQQGASSSAGAGTGGQEPVSGSGGAGGSSTSSSSGTGGAASFDPNAPVKLATDIVIKKVWAMQAVAIPMAESGAETAHETSVVAGRDLAIRVFLGALDSPRPVEIQVVLEPAGGPATMVSLDWSAGKEGLDNSLGTTPVVVIPAAQVKAGSRYSVRVVDSTAPLAAAGASLDARFPKDGSLADLGATTVPILTVTLVPLQWENDGSGRLPDTSPAALEVMRSLLAAQYPVSEVQLTVHPVVPYDHGLTLSGSVDFNDVNDVLYDLRAQDAPASNVYYYGILAPADSFDDYCKGTCVTGQSYTVDDPTSDDIRLGAGVAFDQDDAAGTLAHELGHMLGRYHAPCGTSSWDQDYPYDGGVIGVWGWDPRKKALKGPDAFTDIMGYCDPQWVSDYTYRALFDRMLAVGGPLPQGQ